MFMHDISIISRQTRIFAESKMEEYDLGFPEQRILMFLAHRDSCNQECMSRHFGVDKGSITKSVTKLEKKGFVSRSVNPNNKREKTIALTEEGKSVLDSMKENFEEWDRTIYYGISEADKEAMLRVLNTMAHNALDFTRDSAE